MKRQRQPQIVGESRLKMSKLHCHSGSFHPIIDAYFMTCSFRVVLLQCPQALHGVPATSFTAKLMTCASTKTGSVMAKKTAQMVLMNRSVLHQQSNQHPRMERATLQIVTLKRTCVSGSLQPLQT